MRRHATGPYPIDRRFLGALLGLMCLLAGACVTSTSKAPSRMLDLNKAALVEYRKGHAVEARKHLLEAVDVGKRAGLDQHALMARTQLMLGVVYAGGLKERDKAVAHMGNALKIQPQIALSKSLATPPVRKAFNEARDEARAAQVAQREAEKKARDAERKAENERKAAEKERAREAEKERKLAERERAREAQRQKAAEVERARDAEKERKLADKQKARDAVKEKAAEKERRAAEAEKEKAAEKERRAAEAEKEKAAEKERRAAEAEKEKAAEKERAAEAEKERAAEKEKAAEREREDAERERAVAAAKAANEEPDLPAEIPQPLHCPAPDEAPPETDIVLRCVAQPGLRPAHVLLYYRPPGTETFTEVPMSRSSKGWYMGVVPSKATSGTSLQYYVEAKGGSSPVANGHADSPNLMMVREGAAPVGRGALAAAHWRSKEDPSANVDDNPLADLENERERERVQGDLHRRPAGRLWVAFGAGTGEGWQPGRQLDFRTDHKVGAGPLSGGLVQVLPEIGYQISDELAISVQLRYQYISIEGQGDGTPGSPANGAISVLVRGFRFWGDGNAQLFATGNVGGGEGFRLVVPPTPMADVIRTDTVRGGPVIAGPGVGFLYHFNRHVAWATELRALAGLPDFALVADLATGLQVGF
jgi:hypothetical protein